MSEQRLRMLVVFEHALSPQAQHDVKVAIKDFGDAIDYVGTVRSAVLTGSDDGRRWADDLIRRDTMSKKLNVKKQPQDATLRNVRAGRTRTLTLAARVRRLDARVTRLAARVAGILGLRTDD